MLFACLLVSHIQLVCLLSDIREGSLEKRKECFLSEVAIKSGEEGPSQNLLSLFNQLLLGKPILWIHGVTLCSFSLKKLFKSVFWRYKKLDQIASSGGRGEIGNLGNAQKKTFFFQVPFPYACMSVMSTIGQFLGWLFSLQLLYYLFVYLLVRTTYLCLETPHSGSWSVKSCLRASNTSWCRLSWSW